MLLVRFSLFGLKSFRNFGNVRKSTPGKPPPKTPKQGENYVIKNLSPATSYLYTADSVFPKKFSKIPVFIFDVRTGQPSRFEHGGPFLLIF